ncbi:alpha/beta fold hydrolase [Streptosporangium sp. NPDC002721]|uniref:alpha/beta fold hydrolase n=1 Tax=Streptosporangium sp. NPDC002721 TaxID=3366188 RepID=UPI00367381E1
MKPTVVLVHGAFAESASRGGVVQRLLDDRYPVIAEPDPLRGLSGDTAVVSGILSTIDRPVVLVGHSYGGAVISDAAVELAGASHAVPVSEPVAVAETVLDATRSIG